MDRWVAALRADVVSDVGASGGATPGLIAILSPKDLVETGTRSRRLNHLHIVLWTFVFGVFVIALVRTLVVKAWGRDLALAVAAAIVFQVLTLRQPSTLVGVPLTILLVALLARRYVVRQTPS